MKSAVSIALVLSVFSGLAQAMPSESEYWKYYQNSGDPTPKTYMEWAEDQGWKNPNRLKERVQITPKDRQFMQLTAGDTTGPTWVEWLNPSTPSMAKKVLTPDEVRYIRATAHRDASPPAFHDWLRDNPR